MVSLSVLSQGGEGIKRIATTMAPEGEALCLWERPDFHAGSQGLVFCSRKKCGISFKGRRLGLLGIFHSGCMRLPFLAERLFHPCLHILVEGLWAHGCQPLPGVRDVLLLTPLRDLADSWFSTAAPVGDDAFFALPYAAIAILVLEVDSSGDHLVGLAHYSAVGAGLRSLIGVFHQRTCHLGAGLLQREIQVELFTLMHIA